MTSLLDGITTSLLLSTTLKNAWSFRAVELALDGRCSVAGATVLPIKEYEVIKAIPEERVSERDRGAECGCLCAADEAEDR